MRTRSESIVSIVGHLVPDARWRMRTHQHAFHEIIVPVRGILNVRIHGRVHACGPGTLLLYAAGVAHEEWSDAADPLESYFVAFHSLALQADDLRTAAAPDGRMRQIIRWLYRDQRAMPPGGTPFQRHALRMLVDWFNHGGHPPANAWVDTIHNHIRHHMAESLTLDDLARVAGCSRFHFVRAYRRQTGRTPMADVRRLRADHARELILTTDRPLKEIAPAAGFANEYTLSRTFQQLYGHPPGQLRRNG